MPSNPPPQEVHFTPRKNPPSVKSGYRPDMGWRERTKFEKQDKFSKFNVEREREREREMKRHERK